MNAVEVNHLTRKFRDFRAVDDISFYIPEGEIFGLLGPNGAGKTTTIRILCGVMLPSQGTVRVLNYDVTRNPEEVKKRIGYMSQKFSLYNDLTPIENLTFYASIYGVPGRESAARVEELLQMTNLKEYQSQRTGSLSGAWRQRLALACAIVHRPSMLFLDEATAGVDPIARREFWDLIYKLAGTGVSVLATTHYMSEADYCNTIGMMYQGRMVALASPERLKAEMPGLMIQIDCDRPAEALSLLESLPFDKQVAAHGAQIHLTLFNPADSPAARAVLEQAGIRLNQWEPADPSLEDVFISMVTRRQAHDEPHPPDNKRSAA